MKETNNYTVWKDCNEGRLKVKYNYWIENNYNPVQPDTYQNFDDFCMGQWQCREI